MSLYHKNSKKVTDKKQTTKNKESFLQVGEAPSAERSSDRPRALKLPYIPCLINKILSPSKKKRGRIKAVKRV